MIAEPRKLDDLRHARRDLGLAHAEQAAAYDDVLPAGGVLLHPEAHVQQRRDAAFDADLAIGRLVDSGQDRQKRRFPGTVAADKRDMVAGLELAAHLA
jgi:hypothetical protein